MALLKAVSLPELTANPIVAPSGSAHGVEADTQLLPSFEWKAVAVPPLVSSLNQTGAASRAGDDLEAGPPATARWIATISPFPPDAAITNRAELPMPCRIMIPAEAP